jgi:hypothetical protein
MNESLKHAPKGEPVEPACPRTPLGEQLAQVRKRIVASGEPLLSWDEIEHDIADRRGEANSAA